MIDRFRETFREEAFELLGGLEGALLELESRPGDTKVVASVFRNLHTIKGSGALAGFDDVASFAHEVETVYERVRTGELPVTRELINLTLAARDQIKATIEAAFGGGAVDQEQAEQILSGLGNLLQEENDCALAKGDGQDAPLPTPQGAVTYRIRFRPPEDLFRQGLNPLGLLQELKRLGTVRMAAQVDAIPYLEDLDPESCHVYWDVLLTTTAGESAVRDVFIFVETGSDLTVEVLDAQGRLDLDEAGIDLEQILVEEGELAGPRLARILDREGSLPPVPTLVQGSGAGSSGPLQLCQASETLATSMTPDSIRVRSDKLDSLVDLIGELVTVQARLTQTAAGQNNPDLTTIAEEVERLTWDLRDQMLNVRMLPIGSTFGKFKRLVRDLSANLDKEVELVTEGAETELDKTVIERLQDPLVHLLRNCIDHGIEPPEKRRADGKAPGGRIHLSAAHAGANVLLKVRDDGAGLDLETIRARAVEKGLLGAEAEIGPRELSSLIFTPGLSTVRTVTDVSGRGVGMDVVKQAIDALRGTIEVESQPARGTTFTIKLPLTLAIIDGLLVDVGGERFIMPLAMVEECIELDRRQASASERRNLVKVREEIVPFIRMRERFAIGGQAPQIEQIVIANADGHRIGFVVDGVVGEHQTVIKPLSRIYRRINGLSGATILGDGRVALILDLPRLLEEVEAEERHP